MSLTIRENVPIIENLVVPIDLPEEHQAAIAQAMSALDALQNRKAACRPDSIRQLSQTAAARFAAGEISAAEALAAVSLAGTDDTKCRRISDSLQTAIVLAEREVLAGVSTAVIAAIQLRTDELRRRVAAIEARETEDAEIVGIPFEPSETCRRLRSTFEHSLERLRALRDRGELPSKAEIRQLAE